MTKLQRKIRVGDLVVWSYPQLRALGSIGLILTQPRKLFDTVDVLWIHNNKSYSIETNLHGTPDRS